MDASSEARRIGLDVLESALERVAELETALEVAEGTIERLRGAEPLEDVIARKQLEEQLRQAQKMEAIGELTAGIAHNFNNLLTAIIPSIQIARREATGVAAERLREAEHAAGRAAELVRQLMVFARRDGANRPRQHVVVRDLIAHTVNMCRSTFDRSLDVDVLGGNEMAVVAGDGGQLEQVFLNVCLNARDALSASGKSERAIRIELDTLPNDDEGPGAAWVRVRISDNGSGMSSDVRARIFEPFFTTKEVGRGTGLGLATAYAIVADHGGKLFCESVLGAGTTFTVLLPASSASVPEDRAVPLRHGAGTETVLVIDDERLVRNTVRGVLEPMGYTVREASDGESGLSLFQRERDHVDVVLLDASMRRASGETVFANLVAEASTAKVVLFTEYRTMPAPEGAAGTLQKPFAVEELLHVVREVCDAPRAHFRSG